MTAIAIATAGSWRGVFTMSRPARVAYTRRVSDEELLEAWRLGERSAGDTLLRRHYAAIYRFFLSKVDCAEDLAQRTFQACLESRNAVEGAVRSYLFGIARNQLLMYLRSKGRYRRRFLPQEHSVAASLESPSQLVARQEDERLLLQALRELPLDLQISVELLYWEELSIAEIAEITGVPAGTVKSRLFRARALLRTRLEAAGDGDGAEAMERSMRSLHRATLGPRRPAK